MEAWWDALSSLNKGFLLSALFFSLLFLWQTVGSLIGADHDSAGPGTHGDLGDHDFSGHSTGADHPDSGITFSLISVRSLISFAVMFSWAGTIYLYNGNSLIISVVYSLIWGLVGMFLVSYVIYKLLRFQETGNATVWTAIGEDATVYMDIPENGTGKVRVLVSGAISFIDAKGSYGRAIPSGTHVRVVHVLDEKTLEVEAV